MSANLLRVAFVGLGEASHAYAMGSATAAASMAYDLRAQTARVQFRAKEAGLVCHATPHTGLTGAEVVFCLVTADQAAAAAQACAVHLRPGVLWLDGNSCSPGKKRQAAAVIEAIEGAYVDLAIMAPVHPRRHQTPGLVAGPHAARALALGQALGMNWQIVGDAVGDASSIKMLRSVMVKGIEALSAECLLAARKAGVEDVVLESLQASDPGWNWRDRGAYNLEWMMIHGTRRAAEMREVAATLREFGLPDAMAVATAGWHERLAALALDRGPDDLGNRADRILAALL